MKKLIIVLVIAFIAACNPSGSDCTPGSAPSPPHGSPDDESTYTGSDGYKSVTFTYHCHNGEYKSYTYIRSDECSDYELDSTYESDGIC